MVKRVATATKWDILLKFAEKKQCDEKRLHLIKESQADDNQSEPSPHELMVLNVRSALPINNEIMVELKRDKHNDWTVTLDINQQQANFKIDSGADCTVMSKNLFDRLKLQTKNMVPSQSRLKMYDGSKGYPIGKVRVVIRYRSRHSNADFLVVEQDLPNILGLPSCLALGLIQRV